MPIKLRVSFAALAAIISLTACASVEQPVVAEAPSAVIAIPPAATPEFHGAPIGGDHLRSRLIAES